MRAWREAFIADGLQDWGTVAPGRGRKQVISEETVAQIVRLTTQEKPDGATRWTTRTLAKKVGVSHATVHRIWTGLGLKAHLVDSCQVPNDRVGCT